MATIFTFPQLSGAAAQNGLEALVDDEDTLDFTLLDGGQGKLPFSQTHDKNSQSFDWSNQERADLYRAYSLVQAARPGLECDRGVSDEGDPWFLIGDQQGDVFIHICRIDGLYILDSVTLPHVLTGKDFKSLLDNFLLSATEEDQKIEEPANVIRPTRGGVLCLHPSMMIAALIWTILLDIEGLALPVASPMDDEDEDANSTQDTSLSPDVQSPVSMTNSSNLLDQKLDQKSSGTLVTDWMSELSQAQRDDKPLHTSALSFSYALTTIAAAAGLYTGAQALNTLWGLTEHQGNTSDSPEASEQQSAHSEAVAPKPLVDAFEILRTFADFEFFEDGGEGISHMLTTLKAGALDAIVTLPDAPILKVSSSSEVSIDASIHRFAETPSNDTVSMTRAVTTSGPDGAMTNAAAQKSIETQNPTEEKAETQQQVSFSEATIQNISKTLTAGNFDVSRYNASSLKEWVATADDKTLKSYNINEFISTSNGAFQLDLGSALDTTPSDQSAVNDTPAYSQFTDNARAFIQTKLTTSNMEILLFKNEILIFDKAAVTGSSSSISWQLDDGNVISMIGLSAEFSELFVA